MKVYGTDKVKEANLAMAAQIAASVLGLGLMVDDKEHREQLKQEAEMVNRANRAMEANRMAATINAFTGGPPNAGAGKYAAAAGQSMAKIAAFRAGEIEWDDLEEMEKQAIGGALASLAGKATLGAGKLFGRTGKLVQKAPGMQGFGKGMRRAGGRVGQAGSKMQQWGQAQKPMLEWRGKAALGAGMLGAGYLGYKTLQTGRDYMMRPTASHQRWGAYRPVPTRVSQYGYPQY
jgi:hypothetical protein